MQVEGFGYEGMLVMMKYNPSFHNCFVSPFCSAYSLSFLFQTMLVRANTET